MDQHLYQASSRLKEDLKNTSKEQARNFFNNYGYISSSFMLPEYFSPSGFNDMSLESINWDRGSRFNLKRTKPISVLAPKGSLEWRRFNIIHPYSYWHMVDTITANEADFQTIIEHLTAPTKTSSYTVPKLKKEEISLQGRGISQWLKFAEEDLIKDSSNYDFLAVADIKNFYPSVYTHSIPWALYGKEFAKRRENRGYNLIGNKLDKVFQNCREGQTNGIPVGNAVADFIAEVVMARVDRELDKGLSKDLDCLIGRYRDDYRFLCKTEHDAKDNILRYLNMLLHDYFDLSLNGNKTTIHNEIIIESVRPWVRDTDKSPLLNGAIRKNFPSKLSGRGLYEYLQETYELQYRFPDGRPAIRIINKITEAIDDEELEIDVSLQDMSKIIALCIKLMRIKEDCIPSIIVLLDKILNDKNKDLVEETLRNLHEGILGQADKDYQEIWVHRLSLHHYPDFAEEISNSSDSKLMKMINNKGSHYDYEFFDVVDDDFSSKDKAELRKFSLINRDKLAELYKKPIDSESINPFSY